MEDFIIIIARLFKSIKLLHEKGIYFSDIKHDNTTFDYDTA